MYLNTAPSYCELYIVKGFLSWIWTGAYLILEPSTQNASYLITHLLLNKVQAVRVYKVILVAINLDSLKYSCIHMIAIGECR